jgi:deoxyguanosine kinase
MAPKASAEAIDRKERQVRVESEAQPPPLIGVVGPIGAGKSTLAAGLAEGLGFRLFTERVEDNPFFARFAADQATWAFRSQLAFMLNAVADAMEARRGGPGAVIERPVHEMHAIFVCDQLCNRMIDEEEEMLLRKVVEIGDQAEGRPDLLVLVTASPEVLYERIGNRARPGEEHYSLDYIERLAQAYDDWLDRWSQPLIRVESGSRDLREAAEIGDLVSEVKAALAARRSWVVD